MSFALTTPQILNRSKTVTRRIGWANLKPGTLLQAIEKGQGLKAGEKVRKLAVIRVTDVRREPLIRLWVDGASYWERELPAEGFPSMGVWDFIDMFTASHRVREIGEWPEHRISSRPCKPDDEVTRIEFEYVDEATTS